MESTTRAHTETDSIIEDATTISQRFIGVLETSKATSDEAQQYRDLLESLGVAIYTTDAAGVITFYNKAAAELWGREPEIGKDLWCGSWKIYHLDGSPMPHGECPMAICLKKNRPVRGSEAIGERPDGSRFYFLPFPTPLRDQSGRLAGAINVLVDITRRKRAEEAALHLAAVVSSSDDAIVSKDLDGTITSWNPAAERIFGYTPAEAIGQSIRLIIPPDRQHEEDMVLERLRQGERIDHYETVRRRKDGSLLDISLTISPVKDQTGRVIGASKVARDVTERKLAQTALRRSEERFRDMANTIPSIVWTAAPDGEITYANDRWFEFTGITREQNRRGWPEFVLHPDDRDRCLEAWNRALSEGTDYAIEVRNRRRDGEYRWFLTRATPVRDESGRITAWYGTSSDITERKQAEQALRESEDRFARFMEQLPGLAWIKDEKGRYLYANDAAEAAFGKVRQDLYGKTDHAIFPADIADELAENDRRALASETGVQVVESLEHDDGVLHHSIVSKFPISGPDGNQTLIGGIAIDITERELAEEALRESESRLSIAMDAGQMGSWEWRLDDNTVRWSEALERIHGIEAGTFAGTLEAFLADVHPEDRVTVQKTITRSLETGTHEVEYRIIRPDGRLRWVLGKGRLVRDASGSPSRMAGVCMDITERKQAEEALRESEQRLATELAAAQRLQETSAQLISEDEPEELYEQIMDAAVDIMGSEYASLQMLYPERGTGGELRLLAFRGFNPQAAQFWDWVRAASESTCGEALRTGRRVIVPDVERCDFMAGTDDLETYLQTGIHAVQTTPLFSRSGRLLGMISTHWRRPHEPSARDLRLLDVLARQAADLIERSQAEGQLREERDNLEIVNRIGTMLSAELDSDRLVQSLTDEATRLVGADFGAFFYNVIDAKGESYMLYTVSGAPREAFEKFPMPRNTALFAPTFSGEGIVRLDDVRKDPRYGKSAPFHGMPAGHLPVTSYLAVPVVSRSGEVLGGLLFGHSQPAMFTERHEKILQGVAGQTAIAIENARLFDQLQRSMEVKDQFLGLVSHELRTPITTILGNALLLLRRNENLAEDSKKQALRDVASEAERLQRIIENLLLLTRVDVAEQVETEPLRLQPLIAQAVDVFQRRNTRREISVNADQDVPIVVGQADFLTLVLDNLITNADKYSAPDAPIEVLVRANGEDVEVAVRDHGIGLDEDDIDRVFSPFYRSSRGRNQAKGIGLGLAVCKRVMEAQGGGIRVVNRPEGGCDFIFTVRPYRTADGHED